MCNIDTGVLGQVWWDPKSPKAFPAFVTQHTCKNYEDIRKWAELSQVCSVHADVDAQGPILEYLTRTGL